MWKKTKIFEEKSWNNWNIEFSNDTLIIKTKFVPSASNNFTAKGIIQQSGKITEFIFFSFCTVASETHDMIIRSNIMIIRSNY